MVSGANHWEGQVWQERSDFQSLSLRQADMLSKQSKTYIGLELRRGLYGNEPAITPDSWKPQALGVEEITQGEDTRWEDGLWRSPSELLPSGMSGGEENTRRATNTQTSRRKNRSQWKKVLQGQSTVSKAELSKRMRTKTGENNSNKDWVG